MSLFKNKIIFTAKYRIKTRAFEPSSKKARVAFVWIKKKASSSRKNYWLKNRNLLLYIFSFPIISIISFMTIQFNYKAFGRKIRR